MLRATAACKFWTCQLPQFFHITTSKKRSEPVSFLTFLTCKCASRYSGVQFFDVPTSKSGTGMVCFVHFDFEMCFSLQRHAMACHFATSQLQKVVRTLHFFIHFDLQMCFSRQRRPIFRHTNFKKAVRTRQFFNIFDLQMCFSLQRRAIFPLCNFKKWSEPGSLGVPFFHIPTSKSGPNPSVFNILTLKCASRYSDVPCFDIVTPKSGPNLVCFAHSDLECASCYSGVQFFICPLNSYLRTRRFTEPTFRPSRPTNH